LAAPLAQQTKSISGSVRTPEDTPIAQTEVRIDGAGGNVTSDSGGFSFVLAPPLRVGYPATFHVTGWVIIDPCILARGRTYLPDPDAETIALRALRPGDHRLLSGASIGCIIEEKASRFEPKGASPKGTPTSQVEKEPAFVGDVKNRLGGGRRNPLPEQARLVKANYREKLPANEPARDESNYNQGTETGSTQPILDDFLIRQAKILGVTVGQLRVAVDEWAKSTQDVYQKGLAAFYEGRYAEARGYFSDSIKGTGGEDLERYVSLGRAEYEVGNYPAAETALRKVLAVHGDDPLVLTALGLVLEAQAKYSEAELLHNRALSIDEKGLGPDHADVARVLSNLAQLRISQGRYQETEALYKRALLIDEKSFGPDQPESAKIRAYLAALYFIQGRPGQAEDSFKQALKIDEETLGPKHPDVAEMLFGLGVLYEAQGKFLEAEPLFRRALDIGERAVGPDHPDLAQVLVALAIDQHNQGADAEVGSLMKRALTVTEKGLGPEHPSVADVLNTMAQFHVVQGEFDEAEPLFQRALAIDEKALGITHPSLTPILKDWAESYNAQAKYVKSEPLLRRALAIEVQATGRDGPYVAEISDALEVCLNGLGQKREAKAFHKRAAEIRAKSGKKQ
jgi:tetratricopeptide (TPR) repeat protein